MLQATAGDNCIWCESFISQQAVANNGGTVFGTLVFDRGVTVTANSRVTYDRTRSMLSNTVKCSFHIEGFKTPDVLSSGYIVSKYNATDGIQFIIIQSYDSFRVYVGAGGTNYAYAQSSISANTLYNIDVVYDGSLAAGSRIAIYTNGVSRVVTVFGTIPASLKRNNAKLAVFGYENSFSSKAGMQVKKIRFYPNHALSQTEVTDLCEKDTIQELGQPVIDLPLRSWYYKENGTELLTDGDMEAADTSAWIATQSTISKQTDTPHGGIRVLRVAYLATADGWATQTKLTIGRRYKVTGYARGDGTSAPGFSDNGGGGAWTGTSSTSWQNFNKEFVALGTGVLLSSGSLSSGHYVEFDDVTVELMEAVTQNIGSLKGTIKKGDGTTSTTFPTQLTPHGNSFDGGDYLQHASALASGTYSMIAIAKRTLNSTMYIADARNTGGTGYLYYENSTGYITSSSGTKYVNGAVSAVAPLGQVCAIGVAGITLNAPVKFMLGAAHDASGQWRGSIYAIKLFSGTLTPEQMSIESAKLFKEMNI